MKPSRIGRVLRAIRLHLRISQQAVAAKAGISQSVYSRAERGEIGGMTVDSLDSIASALGATLIIDIGYRGGLGDRLVDAAHAALADLVVRVLDRGGWQIEFEFGFNVFGERGSVDVLAWHAATRTLLIVEVKSRLLDLQDMLIAIAKEASTRARCRAGAARMGRSPRGSPRRDVRLDGEQVGHRQAPRVVLDSATGARTQHSTLAAVAAGTDRRSVAGLARRAGSSCRTPRTFAVGPDDEPG
jgi:transcriptional regulator with XRE-family HTH domain